jgi:UPF0716 protein FxsA
VTVPLLLALAFLVVPLVEIYLIIQVGQAIGAAWTIALLVADSLLGAWLVRFEGRRAWAALQQALRSGRMPSRELADAALILVGGTLLLTPGFVTDVVGFLLLVPLTRPLARRLLGWFVTRRLLGSGRSARSGPRPRRSAHQAAHPPGGQPGGPRRPFPPGPTTDRVIPGKVVPEDPADGDGRKSGPS